MNIKGIITESDTGKQLRGAKVTLFIGDSELAVLYTDRKGVFEHTESEKYSGETFRCEVEMDDYKPQEVKQQVEGEDVDLDIQLIPVRQDKPAPPKRDMMKIGAAALLILMLISNIYLLTITSPLTSNIKISNGNVGIGTTEPEEKLVVEGSPFPTIKIKETRKKGQARLQQVISGQNYWLLGPENVGFKNAYTFYNGGGLHVMVLEEKGNVGIGLTKPLYTLHVNGTVAGIGGYSALSDQRYKKNIKPVLNALDKVLSLRGVNFEWRNNEFQEMNFPENHHLGVIAQEVEKVVPEVVHTDDEGFKSVEYANLVPLLIEAIKEQQAATNELVKQFTALEQSNQQMTDVLRSKTVTESDPKQGGYKFRADE